MEKLFYIVRLDGVTWGKRQGPRAGYLVCDPASESSVKAWLISDLESPSTLSSLPDGGPLCCACFSRAALSASVAALGGGCR